MFMSSTGGTPAGFSMWVLKTTVIAQSSRCLAWGRVKSHWDGRPYDQDNNPYLFYWNLSKEMMLWADGGIDSSSIGPDQTFTLDQMGSARATSHCL